MPPAKQQVQQELPKGRPVTGGGFNPQLALQAMQATGTGFPGVGAALYAARNPAPAEDKGTLAAQKNILDFINKQIEIGGDVPEEAFQALSSDPKIQEAFRAMTLLGQRQQITQRLGRQAYGDVATAESVLEKTLGARQPMLAEDAETIRRGESARRTLGAYEEQASTFPTLGALALSPEVLKAGTGRQQLSLDQLKESRLASETALKQQQDWSNAVSTLIDDIRASGRSPAFQEDISKLAAQIPQGNYEALNLLNAHVSKYDSYIKMLSESDRAYFAQTLQQQGIDPLTADPNDPRVVQAGIQARQKSRSDAVAISRQAGLDAAKYQYEAELNRPVIASKFYDNFKYVYNRDTGLSATANPNATPLQITQNSANVDLRSPDLAKEMDKLEQSIPFANKMSELTAKVWGPGGLLQRAATSGLFGVKTEAEIYKKLVAVKGVAGLSPQEQQAYTDFKAYEAEIKGYATRLRAGAGDVGSVSDFDRTSYVGLLAETGQTSLFTLPDTKEVAYKKPNDFFDILERTQGSILNNQQFKNPRIKRPEQFEQDIVRSRQTPAQTRAEQQLRDATNQLLQQAAPQQQTPGAPPGKVRPPQRRRQQ